MHELLLAVAVTVIPPQKNMCSVELCKLAVVNGRDEFCVMGFLPRTEAREGVILKPGSRHYSQLYRTRINAVGMCSDG